jgi:tetratricopeptide (TPR) repeat protein
MRAIKTMFVITGLLVSLYAFAEEPKKKAEQQKGPTMSELIQQQKYKEAADLGEKFIKANQADFGIYYNLGLAYDNLKDYPKALSNAELAAGMDATSAMPYQLMAAVYHEMGQEDKVIESYEKGLVVDPSNKEMLYNLGHLYEQRKDMAHAMEKYDQLIALDPSYQNVAYDVGVMLQESGDPAKALTYFEKANGAKPDNEDVLLAIAQTQLKLKNWAAAADGFQKFLKVTKKDAYRVAIMQNMAVCYFKANDFTKCAETADQILQARPNDEKGLFFKAEALLAQDDCAKFGPAAESFLAVSKADAMRLPVLKGLCACQYKEKKYKEAASVGQQVVALDPNDEETLLRVANAYNEMKDTRKAIEYYKKFIAVTKDQDLKAKAQKNVKQLGG